MVKIHINANNNKTNDCEKQIYMLTTHEISDCLKKNADNTQIKVSSNQMSTIITTKSIIAKNKHQCLENAK